MKRSIFICLLLLPLWVAAQKVYTVSSVPNTRIQSDFNHVSNPDNILAPEYETLINQALDGIREQSDVFVVCLNSIGEANVEEFSTELFNTWGIGDATQNNGLLMLLVTDYHYFRFEVGYGIEEVMTDLVCRNITENTIIPYFRKDLYGEGIYAGVSKVVDMFGGIMPSDSTLTEEQRSNLLSVAGNNDYSYDYDDTGIFQAIWEECFFDTDHRRPRIFGVLYVFISILLLIGLLIGWKRNLKVEDQTQANIEKATNENGTFLGLAGCLGCGFPVLWLLLPIFGVGKSILRRQQQKCVCGHTMRRLSEAEEDAYLDEKQRMEEDLKVRDYDVWLCDECGRTTILYYNLSNAKSYVVCPLCNYQAAKKIKEETLVRANYNHGGTIQKTYLCKHCNHEFKKRESTPKLTASSSTGSSSGGGYRSSGGHSGGSFGGGRSGGGGYTGRW